MPDFTLDASCDIPEDVIFRELEGEAVILNLESGVYFGLDEVGTRIWQFLVESPRLRDVHRHMLAEFDVAPDTLERDLLAFAAALSAKGLVRLRS